MDFICALDRILGMLENFKDFCQMVSKNIY